MKSEKILLSGNEAVALGAVEAGALVAVGYPGTPSTEILENLSLRDGLYTEWSVNEKVAFEVALGAAMAGARSMVTMKHVGLNVAADPLFTAAYTGVKAGFVVVCADDPGMHSSQNEQDNRNYGYAAKVPVLEPADSQEAKDMTKLAFEISENFDTPVILRTTTRIAHSKSVVTPGKISARVMPSGWSRNVKKYVMIPAYARMRRAEIEKRLERLGRYAETSGINRIELADRSTGFIVSGASSQYVREVFPGASYLKLGMVWPLPEKLIKAFSSKVKKLYVVEELDPFIESRVKALGVKVEGKKLFSPMGEFSQDTIKEAFGLGVKAKPPKGVVAIPPRYPVLCQGCPHRGVFGLLSKLGYVVSGDIGCYTLGVLPPFNAMDTCVDMGASVSAAQGMELANPQNNVAAVIGDSTFAHSGITGLLNAAYNKHKSLIIVLDNGTTAMTGMQPNPLSGKTIKGEETWALDYRKLAEAVGIGPDNFAEVNAFKPAEIEEAMLRLKGTGKLSLLVVKGKCIIHARKSKK
jgi:indolepyruvate ferredoxin oxidoreductase alpha subunit